MNDWAKLKGGSKGMVLRNPEVKAKIRAFYKEHGLKATLSHYHFKVETFERHFPDLGNNKKPERQYSEYDLLRQSHNILLGELDKSNRRITMLENKINMIEDNIAEELADAFNNNLFVPLLKRIIGSRS